MLAPRRYATDRMRAAAALSSPVVEWTRRRRMLAYRPDVAAPRIDAWERSASL